MDTALRSAAITAPRLAQHKMPWSAVTTNAVFLVAILTTIFSIPTAGQPLRTGQVAAETVIAQHRVTYVDEVATRARRQAARFAVPIVYKHDPSVAEARQKQAASFLQHAWAVLEQPMSTAQRQSALASMLPSGVLPAALLQFPTLSLAEWKTVEQQTLQLLSQATVWRFDSNQLTATEVSLLATVPGQTSQRERQAIGDLLIAFLTPTLVPNMAATIAAEKQAARRVAPVMNTIYPGDVVVRRGDEITPTVMEKITALGLQTGRSNPRDVLAGLVFAALIVAMLFWYLRAFQPAVLSSARLVLLIDGAVIATVAGARLVTDGHILLPFFLPVASISTFAAVLLAPEACVAVTLAMALLSGWVVANSFEQALFYFVTGTVGILAIRHVRSIKQFMLAGGYIAVFGFAAVLAFDLLDQHFDLLALREHLAAAAFNGFVSSAAALGAFALFSDFFGVTTVLHLLELSQPSQPLLRRLMVRAPGTYNHSMVVATMVERAADEVGADALLAKVCALYHDVGKVANPQCFVENQLGVGNIHDELEPEESAQLIRGHVTQGLRLARQHHLPRRVLDGIAEHHGTMLIAYFWRRAVQKHGEENLDESLFSYPGPRPQSKETALLMLADGSEAAVRAAKDHSRETIERTVNTIFEERIRSGQLDESPLTLQDLQRVRNAFCSILNGLYHPRIEYPEPVEAQVAAEQV